LEPVIGIDLGTTNSVVAIAGERGAEVIADEHGRTLHPSVVSFRKSGEVVVGHDARARRHADPQHTIVSAKRLIGQSYRNPVVRMALATLPYQTEEGENEQTMIIVRGRRYSVPEISSFVLQHLKACAERYLGTQVRRAVITVPANFTDSQRQATKQAGELAGLKVLRILNEPTAAALAYGFGRSLDTTLAVYDLGGGTFDVTVLRIRDSIFEVLATGGDTFLGGNDFDRALVDDLSGELLRQTHYEIRNDPVARSRLQTACEQIKCRLSDEEAVAGTVHGLGTAPGGEAISLDFERHRAQFERLIEPYVERTITACQEVIIAAGLLPADLSELLLVGGSTRVPLVRTLVARYFGREPQARLNPDETVAYGAAIQAAALTHGRADPGRFYTLLLDVCPRGLGIATAGGYSEIIIDKNTPIPVERTRKFTTSKDGQTDVAIRVSQGESRMFSDNEQLGVLSLRGIPARPRGESVIEVTFTIDESGILSVRARDELTDQETQATVQVFGAPTSAAEAPRLEEGLPAPR
jgi:molecular chaperone DnaK